MHNLESEYEPLTDEELAQFADIAFVELDEEETREQPASDTGPTSGAEQPPAL